MKNAFTLIELMISIILLSLIVGFLYQSVAQLQSSNQQFLESSNKTQQREEILKLLYNDFINAFSIHVNAQEHDHDVITMQSSNSLNTMTQPYLTYQVYKDDNTLRRLESPLENIDFSNLLFRFNEVAKDVRLFKVYEQKGHYLIHMKIEHMDEIYLDIIPPALSTIKANNDTNSSDNNDTQGVESAENNASAA